MWLAIISILLVQAAAVAYVIYTAPEGYEDENGFHYGKPNDES